MTALTTSGAARAFTITDSGRVRERITCRTTEESVEIPLGNDPLTGAPMSARMHHDDVLTSLAGTAIEAPSRRLGNEVFLVHFERVACLMQARGDERRDVYPLDEDALRSSTILWTSARGPMAFRVRVSTDAEPLADAALVLVRSGTRLSFELPAARTRHTLTFAAGLPVLRTATWHEPRIV